MLISLKVKNYALIDDLQLHFGKSLNIITGETGAGKSIILGALGLLLGQRADSTSLLDKTQKCIIEGEFDSANKIIADFFTSHDLDVETRIIIRREISKEGKSRAFINDTPVNISQLKELGDLIVDIHSQHETLLLNHSAFQLSLVDSFAGNFSALSEYKINYVRYKEILKKLEQIKLEEAKAKSEQDYINFQFKEMEEAGLNENENKSDLESELRTLIHAEEIKIGLSKLEEIISSNEVNVMANISGGIQLIQNLSKYNPQLEFITQRLKSVQFELNDIILESTSLSEDISADPERVEVINDRLNLLNKLEQKHRVNSIEELLIIKTNLNEKIFQINSYDDKILLLEKDKTKLLSTLKNLASKISTAREKAIPSIELKVKKILDELGMPNAILKIEQSVLNGEELNVNGKDEIKFLFSANKGVAYSDISKVASGGELSRLMLALKSLVAKLIELPTIVFDEIDTGVSGETAFKIGKVMNELSHSIQLLTITHLPQIASRGEEHFFVYKEVVGKRTFTKVKKLSGDERIVEIARMLSGDKPTAIAIENAKELLGV